jgi:hypothetical protein
MRDPSDADTAGPLTADTNPRRERALTIAYAQAEAEALHVRDAHSNWRDRALGSLI